VAVVYDYDARQENRCIPPVHVDDITMPTGTGMTTYRGAPARLLAFLHVRYAGLRMRCRLIATHTSIVVQLPSTAGGVPIIFVDDTIRDEFRFAANRAYGRATGHAPRRLQPGEEPANPTPSTAAVAASTEE
jgi:hypothetical protein